MTIIVKRPFEPFEGNKVNNVNAEQIHPEFEEKPVTLPITQTSENVHGGSEVTFSLPDSPNNSPANSSEQEKQGNQSTINEQVNQVNASASNADANSSLEPTQEQQNTDSEKLNDGNAGVNNANTTVLDQQQNADNEGSQGTQEPQDTTDDTNAQNVNNGDSETNGTNANAVNNDQGRESGEENGNNSNESENADGEQSQPGTYNTQQVVDVTNTDDAKADSRYYQTEFYRFLELIAEEKVRVFDPMGYGEYNIKKLMFRPYEKKPLSSYKMSRVRESVVIILDNSGSMQWWTDNLTLLARLAAQRNDVEIFLAPNGYIEERLYPKRQQVSHDDVVRRLRNRKIIYVGDFDGADTPIELSWYNDVVWICPEERYIHFLEHDWVHYDESRFKGAFLRVFTLQELFAAFKKLLSTPALRIWHDLCNETHKCGYDEGDENA